MLICISHIPAAAKFQLTQFIRMTVLFCAKSKTQNSNNLFIFVFILLTLFEMLKFNEMGSIRLLVFKPTTVTPTTKDGTASTDGTEDVFRLLANGKRTEDL